MVMTCHIASGMQGELTGRHLTGEDEADEARVFMPNLLKDLVGDGGRAGVVAPLLPDPRLLVLPPGTHTHTLLKRM